MHMRCVYATQYMYGHHASPHDTHLYESRGPSIDERVQHNHHIIRGAEAPCTV